MTRRLYLMRHSESVANARGVRCGGDWDIGLSDVGRADAARIAGLMAGLEHPPQVVCVSSLRRTQETAEIVNKEIGAPVVAIEGWHERFLGEWNNCHMPDMDLKLRAGVTPPGGEGAEEFATRIRGAFGSMVAWLDHRPLLIGSRGVIRVTLEMLTGERNVFLQTGMVVEIELVAGEELRAAAPPRELFPVG